MMYWTAQIGGGPRRVNHAAAAVNHMIFMFGGYCSNDKFYLNERHPIDIHVFNTHNLQWTVLEPGMWKCEDKGGVPYDRYGHTVVAWGTKILLWGGRNDESACNRLFCFNTETFEWTCPTVTGSVPCARDGHTSCLINNTMYVFGGFEELFERYSQEVYALDLKHMHWTYINASGSIPVFRDFHTVTAIGSRMYIFGGRSVLNVASSDEDVYPTDIYYLDTNTMEWFKPVVSGDIPIGRRSHSAFLYNGDIYIFGGYNGLKNEHYNDLHKFNPSKNLWSKVSTMGTAPKKRRRQVCLVIDDKMFLFGGTSPSPYKEFYDQLPLHEAADIDVKLIDHDDLHVLDLAPTLKLLCMFAMIYYNIDVDGLPRDLKIDLQTLKSNNWLRFSAFCEEMDAEY